MYLFRATTVPNLSVIVMQQPSSELVATSNDPSKTQNDGSEEWLLPLLAKEFIEDHDIEWRNLDYNSDVGPPPTSFWLFICQYDCRVFPRTMSERYNIHRYKKSLTKFLVPNTLISTGFYRER